MSDFENLAARLHQPGRRVLHLDNIYRRHHILFVLNDGRVEDSRQKNWRDVEWEKVKRLVVSIKGADHVIEQHPKAHKFFLCFRQVVDGPVTDDRGLIVFDRSEGQKSLVRRQKHIWTVGVTDGRTCFLVDIDFHTGRKINEYIRPLSAIRGHIHPRILALNELHQSLVQA